MNQSFYFELMLTMTEAQISGFQLVDIYKSIYFRSFLKVASNDGSSSDNVYNEWLKLADMELAIELRSAGFTSALSRYIDSLVELHSMYRSAGFPVDYFDCLFFC